MKFFNIVLLGVLVFLASCSEKSPEKEIAPDFKKEKVVGDASATDVQEGKVDILFVVDDSGSMNEHQTNLIANIGRFIGAFTNRANIDFHIGVTTTTNDSFSSRCCGKLNGTIRYVDRNTSNLNQVLSANLRVGINGAGIEDIFGPSLLALTDRVKDGYNQGFYRPDAHLALVFITDAEDQSRLSPQQLYQELVKVKGSKDKVLAFGVIVPSNASISCPRDDVALPTKIEAFLAMVANAGQQNVFSLCDPLFGDQIAKIADDLISFVGNIVYLSRNPDPDTIVVHFGTQVIPPNYPAGWFFNPEKNAIQFGNKTVWTRQPVGTKVLVDYDVLTPVH